MHSSRELSSELTQAPPLRNCAKQAALIWLCARSLHAPFLALHSCTEHPVLRAPLLSLPAQCRQPSSSVAALPPARTTRCSPAGPPAGGAAASSAGQQGQQVRRGRQARNWTAPVTSAAAAGASGPDAMGCLRLQKMPWSVGCSPASALCEGGTGAVPGPGHRDQGGAGAGAGAQTACRSVTALHQLS
jgi:hypothetical protein